VKIKYLRKRERLMSFLIIDRTKCNRDAICATECPSRVIEMKADGGFPSLTSLAKELCIQCGHCVAVCPAGALSLQLMKPEECPPVQKELLVSIEHVEHLIRSRRSVRTYKKNKIDRDIINHLIDIACYTPSIKNLQPVHWLVIEDAGEVNRLASTVVNWIRSMIQGQFEARYSRSATKLIVDKWQDGVDMICHDAPHMIVAHGLKDSRASLTSSMIALTTLELAAYPFGLGTYWAGYFYAAVNFYPPMIKALKIPHNHQCFGALMIGYPKFRYYRIPLRKKPSITWR
jgi:nitroreductase/NAD-dependent dihydropyrimidine dehydrogenase PreA subunit